MIILFKHFADDCVLIDFEAENITAYKDHGEVRLWDDSIKHSGISAKDFKKSVHYNDKLRAKVSNSNNKAPDNFAPLAAVIELSPFQDKGQASLVKLSGQDAMMQIVKSLFRMDPKDALRAKKEFKYVSKLTSKIPIYRLKYPHNYQSLPEVKKLILDFSLSLNNNLNTYDKACGL